MYSCKLCFLETTVEMNQTIPKSMRLYDYDTLYVDTCMVYRDEWWHEHAQTTERSSIWREDDRNWFMLSFTCWPYLPFPKHRSNISLSIVRLHGSNLTRRASCIKLQPAISSKWRSMAMDADAPKFYFIFPKSRHRVRHRSYKYFGLILRIRIEAGYNVLSIGLFF